MHTLKIFRKKNHEFNLKQFWVKKAWPSAKTITHEAKPCVSKKFKKSEVRYYEYALCLIYIYAYKVSYICID